MKFFQFLKEVVASITAHEFTAFLGFCFAVLNIGCIGYLFYDARTLFAVVMCVNFVLFVVPFGYECFRCLTGNKVDNNETGTF